MKCIYLLIIEFILYYKTEFEFDEREQVDITRCVMTVNEDEVKEIESCKYSGFFVQKNRSFDVHVKQV